MTIPWDHVLAYMKAEKTKPKRKGVSALCVLHLEKTPSLLCLHDGPWYCFGCAQGGKTYEELVRKWVMGDDWLADYHIDLIERSYERTLLTNQLSLFPEMDP